MEDAIRLLMLTHNYPRFRGDFAGVFISLLAKRLAETNLRPVVLAPHDEGAPEYEQTDGVIVYRFRYARDPAHQNLAYRGNMQQVVFGSVAGPWRFRRFLRDFHSAARDVIREENIQIVCGHWLIPAGMVMKRLAATCDVPMILSSHGTDIRLMTGFGRPAYRYFKSFCRTLRRWTVVSSYLRDQVLGLDASLADRLTILPLPHDETIFFQDESTESVPSLIVSVTRFTHQKRVDYLIKAFARVAGSEPAARLQIYGSGPLQAQVEQLIGGSGLSDRVTIYAPVPQTELRAVYNRAAVVVLNSFEEGFGLALSEAMMCGAAVIGTASGGIPDIVADRQRGLLVPPDDVEALAQAMLELLDNDSLRQQLAANGHAFAMHNYTSGPLAERYARLVREALD
jgi:glycosyltransferase involved in cell wall biosynthesis